MSQGVPESAYAIVIPCPQPNEHALEAKTHASKRLRSNGLFAGHVAVCLNWDLWLKVWQQGIAEGEMDAI